MQIFSDHIIDRYIILFFIYSVLGYIGEVLYCSIPKHHFVNRGFLHGPYLPIYGFGGLAIRLASGYVGTIGRNPLLVFLFSFVSASIIEYIGSWLLEKQFHVQLWNYKDHFCNINGRVCLLNSTIFGIAGLLLTYVVKPFFSDAFLSIPEVLLEPLALIVVVVMSCDATLSIVRMSAFRKGVEELKQKKKEMDQKVSLFKANVQNAGLKQIMEDELAQMREKFEKGNRRIFDAFPTMTSKNQDFRESLEKLKEGVKTLMKRK